MEQQPTSNVIKGMVLSGVILILILINHFRNNDSEWYQYIIFTVYAVGIVLSCRIYGKQLNNRVTFGNTFAHGFKTAAVVAIMMVVFVLILPMIFPEIREKALKRISDTMTNDPSNSKEAIQANMEEYKKKFTILVIGTTLFGYAVIGLLASLIGAAIVKKDLDTTNQLQA